MRAEHTLKTGLVLGGGGARGAYEAGVLAYLEQELPRELGLPVHFPFLSGTSVGAINACFLAANADQPGARIQSLIDLWRSLAVERVLRIGVGDVMRFLRATFGKVGDERQGGLVDPVGLEELVMKHVAWRQIPRNLRRGLVQGLSVSATHVASGRTTVFLQLPGRALPAWTKDVHFVAEATLIGPNHALASAAIPILFPAVKIRNRLFVDGGLRQSVPLSPSLRMGAERVILVSLRHEAPNKKTEPELPEGKTFASASFLAGKALNALLLDRTDADLERLRRTNALIESGVKSFGHGYFKVLEEALVPHRNQPVRYVRNLLVRPSQDFGKLASDYVRSGEFRKRARGISGSAIIRLVEGEPVDSADLGSYLLFDGGFADRLIELGRRDARALLPEWLQFFSTQPQSVSEALQFEQAQKDSRFVGAL